MPCQHSRPPPWQPKPCAMPAGSHQLGTTSRNRPTHCWKNQWRAVGGNTEQRHPSTPVATPNSWHHPLRPPKQCSAPRLESLRQPAFTTILSSPDFTYPSDLFRVLLLRRLRRPLPLTARHCRCRRPLDSFGDHRATCATSGALRSRAGPLERAAAWVCREAGARVRTHVLVTDLNVTTTSRLDNRRIEVIAHGLPLHNGAQLAVDTTLASPLTSTGEPSRQGRHPRSPALRAARQAKERTYPELVRGDRCRLVVLAMEVGGRWRARSRAVPQALRPAAIQASIARWSALLSQAAQAPFAASFTTQDPATHTGPDGEDIPLSTLLQHCPPTPPPQASRLALRPWGGTPGIGLMPKSKWPGTWSAEAVRATPDPPPSDLHAARRSVRAKK